MTDILVGLTHNGVDKMIEELSGIMSIINIVGISLTVMVLLLLSYA